MASKNVETNVVRIEFDNRGFKEKIKGSIRDVNDLQKNLNKTSENDPFSKLGKSANNVNMSGLSKGIIGIKTNFKALEVAGTGALMSIGAKAASVGAQMVKNLTIAPVLEGFKEYELQLNSVQTILANTKSKGSTLTDVNNALNELNKYADQTIYNFGEMTKNIGTFTSAGVDLQTSVDSIKGISNLAAMSGSSASQAASAMYQLSQALAAGRVSLMDWNSVVNAGMGGEQFQNALKRTSEVLGTGAEAAIKKYGSFRESLTQGQWLTTKVLTETLKQISGAYDEAELRQQGYSKSQAKAILDMSKTAEDAATKIKTFTQLKSVIFESIQSGWSESFKYIIGDFEQAKNMFTSINDAISPIIAQGANRRNNMLNRGLNDSWTQLSNEITKAGGSVEKFEGALTKVAKKNGVDVDGLIKKYGSLEASFKKGWVTADMLGDALGKVGLKATATKKEQEKLNDTFETFKKKTRDIMANKDMTYDEKMLALKKKYKNATKDTYEVAKEAYENEKMSIKDLNAVQLKAIGLSDKQVKSMRNLAEEVKDSDGAFHSLAKNMGKLGGRENILEGFKNMLSPIKTILGSLQTAFRDVFPHTTGEQLYAMTENFRKMSENMKISQAAAADLTSVFRGLFSIVKIGTELIGGPFRLAFEAVKGVIQGVAAALGATTEDVLDILARVGDHITNFANNMDISNIFSKIAYEMTLKFNEIIPKIYTAFKALRFSELGKFVVDGLANGIGEGTSNLMEAVKKVGQMIIDGLKSVLDIHSPSKKTFDIGKNFGDNLKNGIMDVVTIITTTMKRLGTAIRETLDIIDIDEISSVLLKLSGAFAIFKTGNMVGNIGSGVKSLNKVVDSLGGAFKKLGLYFQAKSVESFTQAAKNLAVSLGIIAGAMFALSKIDGSGFGKAIGGLIAAVTGLSAVLIVTSKFANGDAMKFTGSIMGLAAALAVMNQMDIGKAAVNFGKLTVIMAGMNAVFRIISNIPGDNEAMGKMSEMMDKMTGIILKISGVALLLGAVPQSGVKKAYQVTALVAAIGGISLALEKLGSNVNNFNSAEHAVKALTKSIIAIGAFSAAASLIPTKGVGNMAGIVAIIGEITALATVFGKIPGAQSAIMAGGEALETMARTLSEALYTFGTSLLTAVPAVAEIGVAVTAIMAIVDIVTVLVGAMQSVVGLLIGNDLVLTGMKMATKAIEEIGNFLFAITNGLGKAIGGLAGGVLEGASSGISSLVQSVTSIFSSIKQLCSSTEGMDTKGITAMSDIFSAIKDAMGALILSNVNDFFGGKDISSLGTTIEQLGAAINTFSNITANLDVSGVKTASDALQTISEAIKNFSGSGGIMSWITGDNSIGTIADELPRLGNGLSSFSQSLVGVDTSQIKKAADALKQIAEFQNMMSSQGGLAAFFGGEKSLDTFGTQLPRLGQGLADFSSSVSGVDTAQIQKAAEAAKALADFQTSIESHGGLKGLFMGEKDMDMFGTQLPKLGQGLTQFSSSVQGIDTKSIMNASNALTALGDMSNSLPKFGSKWDEWFGDGSIDFEKTAEGFTAIGKAVKQFSSSVSGIELDNSFDFAQIETMISSLNQTVKVMSKNQIDSGAIDNFEKAVTTISKTMSGGMKELVTTVADLSDIGSVQENLGNANKLISSLTKTASALTKVGEVGDSADNAKEAIEKMSDLDFSSLSNIDVPDDISGKLNGVSKSISSIAKILPSIKDAMKTGLFESSIGDQINKFNDAVDSLSNLNLKGLTNKFGKLSTDKTSKDMYEGTIKSIKSVASVVSEINDIDTGIFSSLDKKVDDFKQAANSLKQLQLGNIGDVLKFKSNNKSQSTSPKEIQKVAQSITDMANMIKTIDKALPDTRWGNTSLEQKLKSMKTYFDQFAKLDLGSIVNSMMKSADLKIDKRTGMSDYANKAKELTTTMTGMLDMIKSINEMFNNDSLLDHNIHMAKTDPSKIKKLTSDLEVKMDSFKASLKSLKSLDLDTIISEMSFGKDGKAKINDKQLSSVRQMMTVIQNLIDSVNTIDKMFPKMDTTGLIKDSKEDYKEKIQDIIDQFKQKITGFKDIALCLKDIDMKEIAEGITGGKLGDVKPEMLTQMSQSLQSLSLITDSIDGINDTITEMGGAENKTASKGESSMDNLKQQIQVIKGKINGFKEASLLLKDIHPQEIAAAMSGGKGNDIKEINFDGIKQTIESITTISKAMDSMTSTIQNASGVEKGEAAFGLQGEVAYGDIIKNFKRQILAYKDMVKEIQGINLEEFTNQISGGGNKFQAINVDGIRQSFEAIKGISKMMDSMTSVISENGVTGSKETDGTAVQANIDAIMAKIEGFKVAMGRLQEINFEELNVGFEGIKTFDFSNIDVFKQLIDKVSNIFSNIGDSTTIQANSGEVITSMQGRIQQFQLAMAELKKINFEKDMPNMDALKGYDVSQLDLLKTIISKVSSMFVDIQGAGQMGKGEESLGTAMTSYAEALRTLSDNKFTENLAKIQLPKGFDPNNIQQVASVLKILSTTLQGIQASAGVGKGEFDLATSIKQMCDAVTTISSSDLPAKISKLSMGDNYDPAQVQKTLQAIKTVGSTLQTLQSQMGGGTGGDMSKVCSNMVASVDSVIKVAHKISSMDISAETLMTKIKALNTLKSFNVGAIVKQLQGQATKFKTAGLDFGKQFAAGLRQGTNQAKAASKALADSGVNGIKGQSGKYKTEGTNDASKFVEGLKTKTGAAKSAGTKLGKAGADGAKTAKSSFTDAGLNCAKGFANGISQGTFAAVAKARAMASAAAKAARKELDVRSPSRVMKKVGGYFSEGFAIGIEKQTPLSTKQARGMARTAAFAARAMAKTQSKTIADGFEMNQPTITPIMDFGEAQVQSDNLNKMVGLADQRVKLQNAMNVDSRINATKAVDRVVNAINKLNNNISNLEGGDKINIEGISYDGSSGVEEALSTIVDLATTKNRM